MSRIENKKVKKFHLDSPAEVDSSSHKVDSYHNVDQFNQDLGVIDENEVPRMTLMDKDSQSNKS